MLYGTLIAFASSGLAAAEPGVYVKAHGGAVLAPELDFVTTSGTPAPRTPFDGALETKTGYMVGGAVGYDFKGPLRLEGEVGYRSIDVEDIVTIGGVNVPTDASSMAYMVNGYYDFETNSAFTPYIGGGVGLASSSDLLDDQNATSFAFQVMGGVDYQIARRHRIGVEYRFFRASDFEASVPRDGFTESLSAENRSSNVLLSWRVAFN